MPRLDYAGSVHHPTADPARAVAQRPPKAQGPLWLIAEFLLAAHDRSGAARAVVDRYVKVHRACQVSWRRRLSTGSLCRLCLPRQILAKLVIFGGQDVVGAGLGAVPADDRFDGFFYCSPSEIGASDHVTHWLVPPGYVRRRDGVFAAPELPDSPGDQLLMTGRAHRPEGTGRWVLVCRATGGYRGHR